MDEKEFTPTPEEAKAETEALAEAKEAEVRAKVVADLGLTDDDSNKAVIDKVVAREIGHSKKLSEAIGQKINWREKAKTAKPAPNTPQQQSTPLDAETIRKQTEATVTQQLEQRDLDEMEYPDEIKAQIKHIAQVTNVSIRKASQDPYISFLVEQAKAAGRITEAAVPQGPRSTTARPAKMPSFDMTTEEGRKAFDDWKKSK